MQLHQRLYVVSMIVQCRAYNWMNLEVPDSSAHGTTVTPAWLGHSVSKHTLKMLFKTKFSLMQDFMPPPCFCSLACRCQSRHSIEVPTPHLVSRLVHARLYYSQKVHLGTTSFIDLSCVTIYT